MRLTIRRRRNTSKKKEVFIRSYYTYMYMSFSNIKIDVIYAWVIHCFTYFFFSASPYPKTSLNQLNSVDEFTQISLCNKSSSSV